VYSPKRIIDFHSGSATFKTIRSSSSENARFFANIACCCRLGFDSLTVHQVDDEGLTQIFSLSDSGCDSASDRVQPFPARPEAWLPRWSEGFTVHFAYAISLSVETGTLRVQSAWQSASRCLINAQCHSVLNLGDGVFTAPVSTLSRFWNKAVETWLQSFCGAGFSLVLFTDRAPAGTACQQMNFLIRLSLGLATQTRASEGCGFSAGSASARADGESASATSLA